MDMKKTIHEIILNALGQALSEGELPAEPIPAFVVEQPGDPAHGDFACNAAMASARAFKKAPRAIAEIIVKNIVLDGTGIDRVEIAGPGFINFYAGPSYFAGVLNEVEQQGAEYGCSDSGKGKRVLLEYVSANPTGPMHLGNARGGALGDSLASIMKAAGYYVEREFYVNDAGNQIEKFALSLDIRYQQLIKGEDAVEMPEDSYHGEDIIDHAKAFRAKYGDEWLEKPEKERRAELVKFALPLNIERMKQDLGKYHIEYDNWFFESLLHNEGEVKAVIDSLSERGLTYEKDGAIWYKATEFGGEKDEVLVRNNGIPTYFAADIAYHRNKFLTRGFDICINVWGADHHGHVARLRGAMDAIGLDGSKLEIVLIQLVNLMSGGERVRMSKRTGKAIQLADLLDEVPVDAARFFFAQRESTSKMDFDLELAVQQNSQNPVYYVQYAHARICSIFRKYEENGGKFVPAGLSVLERLGEPTELELIRHIAAFPEEIAASASEREPARIVRYTTELASKFHKAYNACRIISDDEELTQARLTMCDCTRKVIANALAMMQISAPERMEESEG